jgi:hypothetical protein
MRYVRLPQKWMACFVLVALVGGMWAGIILGPGRAEGFVDPELMPVIGLTVGVIQGQMVRLSLHNLSTETVQVAFALVNFQGSAIGPIENPISLGPGKGTFVDIPGSEILGKNDTRVEVTGIVRVFASKKALNAVGVNLAASLQVLDETTHGTVLILPYMNIAGIIAPGM